MKLSGQVVAGLGSTALGVSYLLAVVLAAGDEAGRWIRNDLSYLLFVPLILPFAAALIASVATREVVSHVLRRYQPWSGLGLLVLCALALVGVSLGVGETTVEPFLVKGTEALDLETRLRAGVIETRSGASVLEPDADGQESLGPGERAFELYSRDVPGFSGPADFWRRASVCAYLAVAINAWAALLVALYAWLLFFLVLERLRGVAERPDLYGPLTAILGLGILWFPLRVYSSWYMHFFHFSGTAGGLVTYGAAAVFLVVLLVVLLKPQGGVAAVSTLYALSGAAIAATTRLKPELLWHLYEFLQEIHWFYLILCSLLSALAVGVVAWALAVSRGPAVEPGG